MDLGQLKTLLWLRQRLMRNQWQRGGALNAVVSIIMAVFCIASGVIGAVAGLLIGFFGMSDSSPTGLLMVWDVIIGGFLLFWMIGIVHEIQRSETVDIYRILHLPISLKDVFLLNYLASHLTPSIIFFLPSMLGLCLGLAASRGWLMLLQGTLVLSFIFMITSWTYYLRGWLVALMVNKRRRRTIMVAITFTFVLLCQVPNILANVARFKSRKQPKTVNSTQDQAENEDQAEHVEEVISDVVSQKELFLAVHHYVPVLWVGNGARYFAQGNCLPGLLGSLGCTVIGLLGLRCGYRTTLRYYQGQAGKKLKKVRKKANKAVAKSKELSLLKLPGIPDVASAMGATFLRMLLRAPEVKMALGMNLVMLIIFGGMMFFQRAGNINNNFKPFICTIVVTFNFLGMVQLMFNQFGFDRDGFREMVLMPVERRYILLGKNIAFGIIGYIIGLILLVLVNIMVGFSITIFIATCFQLITATIMMCILGNLFSVLVPFHVSPGSLKPTKASAKTSFMRFLCHLFFPIGMIPVFASPALALLASTLGLLETAKTNLLFSVIMSLIALAIYKVTLPGLGNLLQKREKKIVDIVTDIVE